MGERIVHKGVKKCQAIYPHPNYWIFCGDTFQSCSKQGGPIITYPEVRPCIYTLAALPNNRLLVDDNRGVLHLLDLSAGKVIASQKLTNKRVNRSRFAVSEDGTIAFYVWSWGKKWFLCELELPNLTYHIYNYKPTMNYVGDIVFNAENELLILETQNISIDGKRFSQNMVASVSIQDNICTVVSKYHWDSSHVGLCTDGKYVLESSFTVRELETQNVFSLTEHTDVFLTQNFVALSRIYYPQYKYLQLVNAKENVFIDCEKKKIIACYSNDPNNLIYRGICTGDEFWIGKPDGIYAKPFPMIEE